MNASSLYDDGDLYDLHHGGYRDDLGFYRRLVEDHGGPVLELGAGTGRVTVALARAGARVIAVEPAPAMRARARAVLDEAGVAGLVELVDGDARTLALGTRVPLVVAPFNALMHLETLDDQDAALAGVARHLTEGGAFACDLYVPRFGEAGHVRGERVASASAARDLFVWQEHDPARQLMVTHFRLDERGAGGALTRRAATLRQRYWHRYELERALRTAGLSSIRLYGDFERGRFRPESTVMAAVARRP